MEYKENKHIESGSNRTGSGELSSIEIPETVTLRGEAIENVLHHLYSLQTIVLNGGPRASLGAHKSREDAWMSISDQINGMQSVLMSFDLGDLGRVVMTKAMKDVFKLDEDSD